MRQERGAKGYLMWVRDSPIKMAKMLVYRWSSLPCILIFYVVLPYFPTVFALRYGSPAKTLHLSPSESGLFHQEKGMHVFEVDPDREPNRLMADLADGKKMESDDFDRKRNRRSASSDLPLSSLTNVTTAVSTKLLSWYFGNVLLSPGSTSGVICLLDPKQHAVVSLFVSAMFTNFNEEGDGHAEWSENGGSIYKTLELQTDPPRSEIVVYCAWACLWPISNQVVIYLFIFRNIAYKTIFFFLVRD